MLCPDEIVWKIVKHDILLQRNLLYYSCIGGGNQLVEVLDFLAGLTAYGLPQYLLIYLLPVLPCMVILLCRYTNQGLNLLRWCEEHMLLKLSPFQQLYLV